MTIKPLLGVLVASSALLLTACGSDDSAKPAAESATSSAADTASAAETRCPTEAPPADTAAQWTLPGKTGSVEVTGSTDTHAPKVTVTAPFSVDQTQVKTLTPGNGPDVSANATVSVCYMGVNGRDGNVFDSAYQRGAPIDFALNQVVPGFQKAIAGQKVGSTVAVAMVPADGYPEGQPGANIEPGDSLIFAIKILSAKG